MRVSGERRCSTSGTYRQDAEGQEAWNRRAWLWRVEVGPHKVAWLRVRHGGTKAAYLGRVYILLQEEQRASPAGVIARGGV